MRKRRFAVLLLAVLFVLAAVPSVVGASSQNISDSNTPPLDLSLVENEAYGHFICGLTAGHRAIPAHNLLAMVQSITSDDAHFTTDDVTDDTPAGTGLAITWTRRDGSQGQATLVVAGDVLGTGVLSLSQLQRMALAFTGQEPLTGAYLDAADVNGSGSLSLSDIVTESSMLMDVPDIGEAEENAIVSEAVDIQAGDGSSYKADTFCVVELKAGDVIYGMLPGQSAFYTDAATVEACRGSYTTMYEMLQMLPHPEFGYREQLGSYTVKEDIWAAAGYCLANSTIDGEFAGPGGGFQFVIPDYESVLELSETIDLHE